MTGVRSKLRLGFGVLLWLLALAPLALFALDRAEPGAALSVVGRAGSLAGAGLWILVILGIAALFYPPFLPWLRLRFRRTRDGVSVDQTALQAAQQRLQHLETSDDRFLLAQVHEQAGDRQNALLQVVRALELEPGLLKARALLARLLIDSRREAEAIPVLRSILAEQRDHGFGDTLLRLGLALARSGETAEAARVLEEHEAAHGANRIALLQRARIAVDAGDTARGAALMRRVAAAPAEGEFLPPEAALARAQARVALWRLPRAAEGDPS